MRKIINLILCLFILCGCSIPESESNFELHILDVGQGLCILMKDGNHAMVYDGGPRDKSSYVVSYLKKQGIDSLDYVFASHYDEDHISGLIGIMNTIHIDSLICMDNAVDSEIYYSFTNKIEEKNISKVYAHTSDSFTFGNTSIDVLYANENEEEDNDKSIVLLVTHGKNKILITGDASNVVEKKIVDAYSLKADVLVAGHHGSSSSTSEELLDEIHCDSILISCGLHNDYHHPSIEVLERIQNHSIDMYRTDIQHEIVLFSNGQKYWYSLDPCHVFETNEPLVESVEDYSYIVNLRSMVIHLPDCEGVQKMSEHNKWYTNDSLDLLIETGYKPCKICFF